MATDIAHTHAVEAAAVIGLLPSRPRSRLGITGYGFSPLKLPPGFDYQALFHGVDERVPVEALHFGVRVLDRFLTR